MTRARVPTVEADEGRREELPADAYGGAQERHFTDYIRLLYKRRWTGIPVFLLVVGYATWTTLRATPIYEGTAQLLIEAETQNIITFKEVVEQERPTADYYQTQYKILQSRALAGATIEALKLWDHPELGGGTQSATANESPTIMGRMKLLLSAPLRAVWRGGAESSPAPGPAAAAPAEKNPDDETETAAQSRAIHAFLARLTIAPVRASRLVDVKYRSTDPALAAAAANALARAYIDRNLQFKFMASKEASDWLANQLAEQRKRVEASEGALQRYREQNDAVSSDDPQLMQKIAELNSSVTRANTDRMNKEALYHQLVARRHDQKALDAVQPIMANPTIQRLKGEIADLRRQEAQLSERLGNRHPDLIKVRSTIQSVEAELEREISGVVEAVHNDFLTAQLQERNLGVALQKQKAELLALNRKGSDYRALEREAASNQQIFDSLLQRTQETGISRELKTNNIRIADEADLPRVPVWPATRQNLMVGFSAGLALAIGLSFLVEYLANKIKTPDEIRELLGLQCLGLVPKVIRSPTASDSSLLLNNGVPAVFAESFRAVRTNVLFATQQEVHSLAITSSGPGEGKSMVASNLAVGLALAGQRVLLIDADLRRSKVHGIFGVDQSPGLAELLLKEVPTRGTIKASSVPGLWILPSGNPPQNPAELLSRRRFREILNIFEQHFEWVIIDSPPVMAVTDASIVAHTVSAVIFVVSAELTSRPAAQRALQQLDAARANLVGAVLNRVDWKRNGFFYAPYFRREYGDYYGVSARD